MTKLPRCPALTWPADLNRSYWHFVIRSSKNEWIRFKPDSISILLFGTYDNPDYAEGHANPRIAAQRHALRSGEAVPSMYLDPSVLGTGFVDRVDVSINNVPVPTNTAMGKLLLHYVRMARIFNTKPGPMLTKNTSINRPVGGRNALRAPMATATQPFDYYTWNSTTGQRVPIFLESIDRASEPNLFFPPRYGNFGKSSRSPGQIGGRFSRRSHNGKLLCHK